MLTDEDLKKLLENSGESKDDARSIASVLALMDVYQKTLDAAGTAKWFVPDGPYPIEKCPKHKLFFDATKKYNELLFCAGNRTGKTLSGAFVMACHLTGGINRPFTQ